VVLKRAGHDLGGARRALVDEDDERQVAPPLRGAVEELAVRVGRPPAHAHDLFPAVEKEVGDGDALVEQAAGVVAQVEDELAHPLLPEPLDGALDLVGAALAEDGQVDVPGARLEHDGVLHRRDLDLAPRHGHGEALGDAGPLDGQHDLRPVLAAQRARGLVGAPPLGADAVDGDDAVAPLEAGPGRGRAGERGDDGDPAVADVDLDADAGVVPAGALGQPSKTVTGQIDRMRVVQLAEESLDGLLVEVVLWHRVDVELRHVLEDVVEEARAIHGPPAVLHPLLEEPAARDEREPQNGKHDHRA
jgi:hypothetical protein